VTWLSRVFKKEHMLSVIDLLVKKKITEDGAVDIIRTLLDKGGRPTRSLKKKAS